VKLKTDEDKWQEDQKAALEWAKKTLDKMDPHAKEDIQKFQEKLQKVDRELDRHNKVQLTASVDYLQIKEEFNTLNDKKNALEETYHCLNE